MKKILYALCLSLCFVHCSKDDSFSISFTADELSIIDNFSLGEYYNSRGKLYLIPFPLVIQEGFVNEKIAALRACDGICPNHYFQHETPGRIFFYASGKDENFFQCNECLAHYNMKTGKSMNTESNGTRLNVYKIDYNKSTNKYTLWK